MKVLKKRLRLIIIIFFVFLLARSKVFADQAMDSVLNRQIDLLDLSEMEKAIENASREVSTPYLEEFSIKETMINSIKGEDVITPLSIFKGLASMVFGEINEYLNLMGRLIIIAIFSTMLSTLGTSFNSKSTSEVAFYVCYIVLIIVLAESFMISMNIARNTIDHMSLTMKASIPVMITLLVSTGNAASGGIFQPLVFATIQIGSEIIKNVVLPLVFFVSVLQIVTNISEDFKIDSLVELAYSIIKWILRGLVTVFVGVMGLHGLTTPFVDGTINKAAKSMTSAFVPVVGEALSGTVDLVINCGVIVKNSYTVGVIIALLLICAVPLIKVFLCMAAYQVTAAIIEPISDKRIASCLEGMGRATGYLLGTLTTVMVLFILNMLILVGVSNITAMMR